jgi:ATP sulfurylase
MKTITIEGKKHLFSVPITQHLTKASHEELKGEKSITLKSNGKVLAVIENPTFFENRREEISARIFGTSSTKHPKVERILA